jgi:Fungal chitosanase of glycosyl hydrolase group 75
MEINFAAAETFRGTQIFRQADNLAYAYETDYKSVDADGAPNAYHPEDIGLDFLANAGYPHSNWWKDVLVPDPGHPSKAYVQKDGPFAGYFIAMTSLRNPRGSQLKPETYVDSTRFPYVVLPTGFSSLPNVAKAGDVGVATNLATGQTCTFIVGDAGGGSDARLGEASIALFIALGGQNPNPRTGAGVPSGKLQYVLFPNSRKAGPGIWPRTNEDIHQQALDLASSMPGIHP